jgi:flavin-dependent dehydrogenase
MVARARTKIVVVGGGPSGLSTALFLAHARPEWTDRIVVLEKERYPRDKFCAGGVGARADKKLGAIGVVVDVPSAHANGISVATRFGRMAARAGDIGRVVRRYQFDHRLAERARERGIRIVEGARVTEIAPDPDGVTVESTTGTFRADVVIGADGVGSFVRKSIGLSPGRLRAQVIECDTPRVDGDPDPDLLHFDLADRTLRGYGWDFPTIVDGREMVCRGIYQLKDAGDDERDVKDRLAAYLAARGLDIGHVKTKRYAERGFDWGGPISAARILLVGEAAGIDGATGEGIAQGVEYAVAAAEYLDERLTDNRVVFEDWRAFVTRRIVGVDLAARRAFLDLAYAEKTRPFVEHWITKSPWVIRTLSARFMGGYPPLGASTRALAAAVPSALASLAHAEPS